MGNSKRPSWFKMFLHQGPLIMAVPDDAAGKALKAAFQYFDDGKEPELDPLPMAVYAAIKPYIDEAFGDYKKTQERNKSNIAKRWNKPLDTTRTTGNDLIPLDTTHTEEEKEAEAEGEAEREGEYKGDKQLSRAKSKPDRKQYGQYGWVKLSQEEYDRLSNDLGEKEVKRCIAYLDESAQSTGNKNKWRDWNLVIRRCNRDRWGLKEAATGRNAIKTAADYDTGGDFFSC